MHNFILAVGICLLPIFSEPHGGAVTTPAPSTESTAAPTLYAEMNLKGKVSEKAFNYAIEGYQKISNRKKDILTLIDFSKPSNQERLYVLDMKNKKVLYSSVVAHGRNSGGLMATQFSNQYGSHKSSLGFYLTQNTYQGKNGYSLVLDGLEKGVNDNAKRRTIVIHGADYANPAVTRNGNRLGRSFGCPALPRSVNKPIIDAIKNGSVLYIYAGNKEYLAQSSFIDHKNIF